VLRFCGRTVFAAGLWAGVALDEPAGKNNGSVDGILYFRCPPDYGANTLLPHSVYSSSSSIVYIALSSIIVFGFSASYCMFSDFALYVYYLICVCHM